MPACIDLRKAHLHRQHGDLLAVYTWINGERCLVLIPAFRPKAPWYVVMESAAYQYDDPAYLARQCVKACEVLGIEPTRANWVRVGTIINEGLPDLYRMPSEPVRESKGWRVSLSGLVDRHRLGGRKTQTKKEAWPQLCPNLGNEFNRIDEVRSCGPVPS